MRRIPDKNGKIVIKLGTNLITDGKDIIYTERIDSLVEQIVELRTRGHKVILVTSGAIGCGMQILGMKDRPEDIKELQAIAAVGQPHLMALYEDKFNAHRIKIGQLLLSHDDLKDAERGDNTRNTIDQLLNMDIIPIINENDPVAIYELRYGDNDILSAIVSVLLYVDLYIILTDVEGLCDKNPKTTSDYEIIKYVEKIDDNLEKLIEDSGYSSFGGMESKIKAMKKVTNVGVPAIITSGTIQDVLIKLLDGEELGTFFAAQV